MFRRLGREYDMGTALDGIRQTAKGRPDAKFTTLMHHIYAVDRLRAAYFALKRKAAAGGGRRDVAVVRTGPGKPGFWICLTGWAEGLTGPSL